MRVHEKDGVGEIKEGEERGDFLDDSDGETLFDGESLPVRGEAGRHERSSDVAYMALDRKAALLMACADTLKSFPEHSKTAAQLKSTADDYYRAIRDASDDGLQLVMDLLRDEKKDIAAETMRVAMENRGVKRGRASHPLVGPAPAITPIAPGVSSTPSGPSAVLGTPLPTRKPPSGVPEPTLAPPSAPPAQKAAAATASLNALRGTPVFPLVLKDNKALQLQYYMLLAAGLSPESKLVLDGAAHYFLHLAKMDFTTLKSGYAAAKTKHAPLAPRSAFLLGKPIRNWPKCCEREGEFHAQLLRELADMPMSQLWGFLRQHGPKLPSGE